MVRTAAATISASPLRTLASTLRRKCTRHRCQLAPCSTAATAAASPRWASLMTRCTPVSPRSRSERKNSVQNSSVSLSPTAWPSTSRRPSADTPVATTTACETPRPVEAHLAVGGVGEQVGEGGLERPLRARGHLGVERGTNPADLALAHPDEPAHRRDHVVDLAGAHPVDVGLGDDGVQRPVDAPARLEQGGKNEPVRVLGIVTVTSPAAVVRVFGPDPLRWVVRVGVRSCGPAPIAAVASSAMSAWSTPVSSRLTNCPPSAVRSTSSRSCKADLSRAIAWAPLCEFLGRSHRASRDASPLPAVTRCRLARSPRLPTPRKGTHLPGR